MPSALSPPPHKCTPPTAANRPSCLRAAWRSSPRIFHAVDVVSSTTSSRAASSRMHSCRAHFFFTAQTRCPHVHRISEALARRARVRSLRQDGSADVPSSTTNSRAASHPRGAGASIYTTLGAAHALRTRRYVLTSRKCEIEEETYHVRRLAPRTFTARCEGGAMRRARENSRLGPRTLIYRVNGRRYEPPTRRVSVYMSW
ncbi:hypothetical protein C8J57DRAFT_1263661 [Mycena rebaudengoi]|nr:hypothetical protein C8J57DRAFT_1263661 [Mycena rebaudengoi]